MKNKVAGYLEDGICEEKQACSECECEIAYMSFCLQDIFSEADI